jgi:cytochrome c oxidase subunit 2
VELAWTVIPILIVVTLFLATARVIADIQNAERPGSPTEIVAIGHQFWWEYRFPALNVVTANELHIPVSDPANPNPTHIKLLSADTDHSFWVPRLMGKTDLIPNRVNHMWIEPTEAGLYLGQCAQYCGTQHAKMLLRVCESRGVRPLDWEQSQAGSLLKLGFRTESSELRVLTYAWRNSRRRTLRVRLTHLMSRETIAAGRRRIPGKFRF